MKRVTLFLIAVLLCSFAFAQEITVRFTGLLNGTAYQQLDSVVVTNSVSGWTETVVYPDTLIVLGTTENISESETFVAGLGQNVPNPFNCQTRVRLTVSQQESVHMQLLDASGKQYADYNGTMDAGTHEFEISAANPQAYVLNAIAGGKSYSIRMVNVGNGCDNYIKYAGSGNGLVAKLTTTNEFHAGDLMQYVGYATYDTETLVSETVLREQVENDTILLNFTIDLCETTYGTDVQNACDSLTWIDGNTYAESNNTATYTLLNAEGCDSVVTLNLTIRHSSAGTDVHEACESYTWIDGITYTESNNTATYTMLNAEGCDSVVTLDLTINHPNAGVDTQIASDSYTWIDGTTYTESTNTPTYTLTNAAGCDSIVTLNLTICHCGDEYYRVADYDGNEYATVKFGEQCWMSQNLKTTHFADGTYIAIDSITSETSAYRYIPNGDSSNIETRGYLYNWPAAMHGASSSETNPSNVQGVCPNGWHLPSRAEWMELTDYVSLQSEYQCQSNVNYVAKSLSSTIGWDSTTQLCAVGNTPEDNNSTGFSAISAGGYDGTYVHFGRDANLWTATEENDSRAYGYSFVYALPHVHKGVGLKYYGFSIRCVKD